MNTRSMDPLPTIAPLARYVAGGIPQKDVVRIKPVGDVYDVVRRDTGRRIGNVEQVNGSWRARRADGATIDFDGRVFWFTHRRHAVGELIHLVVRDERAQEQERVQ